MEKNVNPRNDSDLAPIYWEGSNSPEFCALLVDWAVDCAKKGIPISWAPTMAKDTMSRALKLAGLKGVENV